MHRRLLKRLLRTNTDLTARQVSEINEQLYTALSSLTEGESLDTVCGSGAKKPTKAAAPFSLDSRRLSLWAASSFLLSGPLRTKQREEGGHAPTHMGTRTHPKRGGRSAHPLKVWEGNHTPTRMGWEARTSCVRPSSESLTGSFEVPERGPGQSRRRHDGPTCSAVCASAKSSTPNMEGFFSSLKVVRVAKQTLITFLKFVLTLCKVPRHKDRNH